jgi:23S rRNA pseudouridine1911/1915/1917 synthase
MDEKDSELEPMEPGRPSRFLALVQENGGTRLDLFLATELALSRAQVRRLLDSGAVALDGRGLGLGDKGLALPAKGVLEVAAYRAGRDQVVHPNGPDDVEPRILARGEGWLALDKPAGMPVHPLDETESGTVLSYVVAHEPGVQGVGEGGLRSGIVHRLDVDTSGVLLVATEEALWQKLRLAFQEHRVEKTYRALVEGRPSWSRQGEEMRLWLSVSRHRPARVRVASDADRTRGRAREIHQSVLVLETFETTSLVEIRPRTGFLHQIRASLSHLGHPVVGDVRYGATPEYLGARRHMLHAQRAQHEEIGAECPPAEDFERALLAARTAKLISGPESG